MLCKVTANTSIVVLASLLAVPCFAALKPGTVAPLFKAPAYLAGKPFTFDLAEALKLETIHSRRFGASEDAGFLIERVQQNGGQAAYLILGANLAAPHHHPEFDFDEAVLEHGVALLESWLLSRLGT